MKLLFKIDKDYLIYYSINNTSPDRFSSLIYKDDIINLQNYAWDLSKETNDLLRGLALPNTLNISNTDTSISDFFNNIKNSNEFRIVYKQTLDSLEDCKKEWQSNLEKSKGIMNEMTGLEFNKEMTVYITHPSLKNGKYNNNIIEWSHNSEQDWPNYSTVYLWHEILHSYFDYSEYSHSIIQLVTDNELRVKLNGGNYPPFEGHKELFPLMNELLQKWIEYLSGSQRDIIDFWKKNRNKFDS